MNLYLVEELPEDVIVYHRALGRHNRGCYFETAGECLKREGRLSPYLEFQLQGGLWASRAAIGYWKSYPYCHPHYTLFEALYTHLMKN